MTPTVSEPVRDEPWDAQELVPCDVCDGKKTVTRLRADGTTVTRKCKECSGLGKLLRCNPPDEPYLITHDFCAAMYPCCTGRTA
jgi:RecJ-like exonuclease